MKIRSLTTIALALSGATVPAAAQPDPRGVPIVPELLGWDGGFEDSNTLTAIDPLAPSSIAIGPNQNGSVTAVNEIEFMDGLVIAHEGSNGSDFIYSVDPDTGVVLDTVTINFPRDTDSINALEAVEGVLYGALFDRDFMPDAGGGGGMQGDSILVIIDTTTGDLTEIGPMGIVGPATGLTCDGETMYGVLGGGNDARLFTVDLATGATTDVATVMLDGSPIRITALEFTADGTLYATSAQNSPFNNHLLTIDPTTGIATDLGDTGANNLLALTSTFEPTAPQPDPSLFAWGDDTTSLWGVDASVPSAFEIGNTQSLMSSVPEIEFRDGVVYVSERDGNLHQVDPSTGDIMSSVAMTFPAEGNVVTALEFIDGVLYGGLTMTGAGNVAFLVTVDPATGIVTLVGDTGLSSALVGLAFDGLTLYAVTGAGSDAELHAIDPGTGAATLIAQIDDAGSPVQLTALEFDADGLLYALGPEDVGNRDVLYLIDPFTGVATDLGVPAGTEPAGGLLTLTSTLSDESIEPPTLFAWSNNFVDGHALFGIDSDAPAGIMLGGPQAILESVPEIELDPSTGMFYAVDAANPSPTLYEIDPAGNVTNETSLVFPDARDDITSLEFVDGVLFATLSDGAAGESALCVIDTTTADVTLVGATGVMRPFGGLAFDGVNLYAVTSDAQDAQLHTLNRNTGASTLVGEVSIGGSPVLLSALEFDIDGTLYALGIDKGANRNRLYSINPLNASGMNAGLVADLGPDDILSSLTSSRDDTGLPAADLEITAMEDPIFWGIADGMAAYSVGATVCNTGGGPVSFDGLSGDNPVLVQNLFVVENGILRQVGLSYAHHPLGVLTESDCDGCVPAGFFDLGPGCSARLESPVVGIQPDLGPRNDLDPTTGVFPFPFTQDGETGNSIFKRLQIDAGLDLMGADLVLAEVQILSADEIAKGGDPDNNIHAAAITAAGPALTSGKSDAISSVEVYSDLPDSSFATASTGDDDDLDGRVNATSRVIDNGDDTWTYVYAIHNQSSDRAIAGVSVPKVFPTEVLSSEMFFPARHSGEEAGHQNTDWVASGGLSGDNFMAFNTDTMDVDSTSNRIGWGTTYTFVFTCNAPPAGLGPVTLGVWNTDGGDNDAFTLMLDVPSDMVPNINCRAAANFGADGNPDLNFNDVLAFLTTFLDAASGDLLAMRRANFDTDGAGFPNVCDPTYTINFNDVLAFLNAFSDDATCGIPCSLADVAPPFGMIDMADQTTYNNAFADAMITMDDTSFNFRLADMDCDGDVDNDDATIFNDLFVAGCGP